MTPPIVIIPNGVDEEYANELIAWIDAHEPEINPFQRKVLHYGYFYNYQSTSLISTVPIPEVFIPLKILLEAHVSLHLHEQVVFDQIIVNVYDRNQRIGAHVDNVHKFDNVIASLSLLDSTDIVFRNLSTKKIAFYMLNHNDIMLMHGDYRYKWSHETSKCQTKRISITFRSINPRYQPIDL